MTQTYPKARTDLVCPECGALMVIRKSPKFDNPFYGCSTFPDCRGSHGAHASGEPHGIPGNKATKDARIQLHALFDKLWKDRGPMKRGEAYEWFQGVLGMTEDECHIARFDVEACQRAEKVVRDELLRRRLIEIDPKVVLALWLLYTLFGDDITEDLKIKFEDGMWHNDEKMLAEPALAVLGWSTLGSTGDKVEQKVIAVAQGIVSEWADKALGATGNSDKKV